MRAALLALAACGSPAHVAKHEPLDPRFPTFERHAARTRATVPPPRVDVATVLPARDLPWPLTEPPSTQPHLDIAMAHDACEPAFAKRHANESELREYVAAWCKLRDGDRSAIEDLVACASVAHPREGRPGTPGAELARAARLDVANLLADYSGSVAALAMLGRHALDTADMLDLLAASYAALGDHDEAFAVGTQVAANDGAAAPANVCERLLAWSNLATPALMDRLLAVPDEVGDCAKRAHALGCAIGAAGVADSAFGTRLIAMRECFAALPDEPQREAKLVVVLVHASWGDQTASEWESLAREAETADLPIAATLARAARENAARTH